MVYLLFTKSVLNDLLSFTTYYFTRFILKSCVRGAKTVTAVASVTVLLSVGPVVGVLSYSNIRLSRLKLGASIQV